MNDHVSMSGMNERGFSTHVLWLADTKVAPRNPKLPGLSITMWMQWLLDSFTTVKEAVKASENLPFQIRMAMDEHGTKGLFHIAVEDPGGDSAIFEMVDGELKIYHDRRYIVMTNEPTYDKQLTILSQYAGLGGDKPLPGTHEPSDRLVRGAFYAKNLPAPSNERNAIAALLSVMRNVGIPFGMPTPERQATHAEASPNVTFTIFRMILNLTQRMLFFDRVMSPTVFWVKLDGLDFDEGAPVKKLATAGNDIALDATDKFKPAQMFAFLPATELVSGTASS
jgi:choloylglycine hydrolase